MSASFLSASSQRLVNPAAQITTYPFTLAAWLQTTTVAVTQASIIALTDTATTNNYFELRRTTAGITFACAAGSAEVTASPAGGIAVGKWSFTIARGISATQRRISLLDDKGSITHATSITSRTPTSIDTIAIGSRESSAPTNFFDGLIAECWLLNNDVMFSQLTNLDNNLMRKLAYEGPFSLPHTARNIVEYHSFRHNLSSDSFNNDDDNFLAGIISDLETLTNTNGVTLGPHPPLLYEGRRDPYIIRPRGIQQLFAGMAAGGGIDTTAPRAGTSTGIALVSGKIAVVNEHRGISTGVAVVTGREAVQDAKRSTVVGKAVVAGTATQNTTFTRSGTSTGVAVVTARDASQDAKRSTVIGKAVVAGTLIQETQLSKSGSSIGVAVDTGREAVQDAKRSTVTGVAVVTGVATSVSARDQFRSGTSTGVAVVIARDASQDAKRSTVAGVAAVAAKGAVQDAKRSTVLGKAVVTGVGTSSSEGGAQSRAGTSVGLAIVNARTAWMAEIAGHAIGVAIVNGVATSSGGAGTSDETRFNPLIASVAKLMNR